MDIEHQKTKRDHEISSGEMCGVKEKGKRGLDKGRGWAGGGKKKGLRCVGREKKNDARHAKFP